MTKTKEDKVIQIYNFRKIEPQESCYQGCKHLKVHNSSFIYNGRYKCQLTKIEKSIDEFKNYICDRYTPNKRK